MSLDLSQINNEIKKVLLIRSAPWYQTYMAINWLKNHFPQAKITFMVQPVAHQIELLKNQVDEFLVYEKNRFNVFGFRWRVLNKLRGQRFDIVAILYNNILGEGYFNVELLAFAIKSRYKLAFDFEGEPDLLTFPSWGYRIIQRLIRNLFYREDHGLYQFCPKCKSKLLYIKLILLGMLEIREYHCNRCKDEVFICFGLAQSYEPRGKIWSYFRNARQVFYKNKWLTLEKIINQDSHIRSKGALRGLQSYLRQISDNNLPLPPDGFIKIVRCEDASRDNNLIKYLYADMWGNSWHLFADFLPLLYEDIVKKDNNKEKIILALHSQLRLFKLLFPILENYIAIDDRCLTSWPCYSALNKLLSELSNNLRLVRSPLTLKEATKLWNSHLKGWLSEALESTPEYYKFRSLKEDYKPIVFLNIRFKDSRYWSPRSNTYEFYRRLKQNYPEAYLILHGMPETRDNARSYIEDNFLNKLENEDCYFCFDKDMIEQLVVAKISDVCIFPHGAAEGLGVFQDKDMIVLSIKERADEDECMFQYVSKGAKHCVLYSRTLKGEPLNKEKPIKIGLEVVLEEIDKTLGG